MPPHLRFLALVLAAAGLAFLTVNGFKLGRAVTQELRPGNIWSFRYSSENGSCVTSYREDAGVELNDLELTLEIARTDAARTKGLSGRACLPDDVGMLFVFPTADLYPFWMIDMKFPIDMIWIRDGVVMEIARNVPPPSETLGVPRTHTPAKTADMVLELAAGGAERYGLAVGSDVSVLVDVAR